METTDLTIEIPKDKEIDWDESKKQNRIILKNKELTYKDICKKLFEKGYYFIDTFGEIHPMDPCYSTLTICSDLNNASSFHQLECILAKNKLANVAVYLNSKWLPKEGDRVFYIGDPHSDIDDIPEFVYPGPFGDSCYNKILFKSKELAMQAIKILGEEIIKLALEPLGI